MDTMAMEVAPVDEDEEAVRDLLRSLCDGLTFSPVDQKRREILSHVRKPRSLNRVLSLSRTSSTYKHRLQLTRTFLSEREKITESEIRRELENYIADKQELCLDQDLLEKLEDKQSSRQVPGNVNWLEEGCSDEIHGVVLRRSPNYLALLVVPADPNTNQRPDQETETVIPSQDDFPGLFGVELKIGDMISVRLCLANDAKERKVVNISLKSLIGRTEEEADSFLQKIINTHHTEGSAVALSTILSCFAVWSHIVSERCGKETVEGNTPVTERVLLLCCNIMDTCTEHSYKTSLEKLFRPFVETTFLTSTLQQFIDNAGKIPRNRTQMELARGFLQHVTKTHPECGLAVLPLAQKLVPYNTNSSPEFEGFKSEGRSNEEFLIKLCTALASKVPNAFEVNDPSSLPWKMMPLIPLPKEIQSYRNAKTDHLPRVRRGTNADEKKYDSVRQYLHTYFTLLREECFFKLKKGILGFLNGDLDPKDMALYRVSLEGVKTIPKPYIGGLSLVLSFKFNDPAKTSDLQNIDWESFQWLKHGNLLCLSLDKTFRQPIWACVSDTEERDRGFVSITMFSDRNMQADLNVAEVLCKLQELKDKGVKAYLAESHTFYTAFGHAMEVLQEREKVPFEDSLVFAEAPGPAQYITEALKVSPDWSGIFPSEDLAVSKSCDNANDLLMDFEEKKKNNKNPKLDETQLAAVEVALKHKLALIQGPPGTGKTHVGLALVKLLLSLKKNLKLGPILVVTYKNLALNHFLTKCLEMLPPTTHDRIVRIGKNWNDTEGELRKCTINEVAERIKVKRYSTRDICRELEELEMRLLSSSEKLQQANMFSSIVFREVAEDEHIFHLLTGDGETPGLVEHAEAQRLVYQSSTAGKEESDADNLDDHITSSLRKWLPTEDRFYSHSSGQSHTVPKSSSTDKLLGDNPNKSNKSKDSDQNETQEDSVGSCLEHSAEERERFEALGEEPDDDEQISDRPRAGMSSPVWSQLLPTLPEETLSQYKYLLNTVNPWKLKAEERVQFAYVLLKRFRDKAKQEFLQAHQEYVEKRDQLQLLRRQFDMRVLRKCHIIGMTVTGAAMRSDILANVQPSIMIVEEAAEVLEAQLLAAIPLSVQHLIMIGDHMQLKPQVHHQRLRKLNHMDLSMFERLANCGLPLQQLGYQCRMRKEFADLLNKLQLYKVPLKTNEKLVDDNHPPNCIRSSMFFQTHSVEEEDTRDSHSKFNQREVVHVRKVAKHLYDRGYDKNRITVLCSYRGQVGRISHEFEQAGLQGIEVTTIDSFQGQEQDIVLISLVRSRGRNIGYLASLNRLCVAISRARCGMYLFGNDLTLASKSSGGWKKIIDAMRQLRLTGDKFPFVEPGEQGEQVKESTRNFCGGGDRSKDVVDDEVIRPLASDIIRVWKKVGRALGLKDTDLNQLEADIRDDSYERSYAMLQKWRQSKGREATLEALAKALTDEPVGHRQLAEKYCYANFSDKPKQQQNDRPFSVCESKDNIARENQAATAACREGKPLQVAAEGGTGDDTGVPTQVAIEEETEPSQTTGDAKIPTQVAAEGKAEQPQTAGDAKVPTQVAAEEETKLSQITDDARAPTQVATLCTAVKESAQSSGPTQDTSRLVEKKAINVPNVGAAGGNTEQSGAVGAKTPVSSRPSPLPSEQRTLASEQEERTIQWDLHQQKDTTDPVQETLLPQGKGAPLEEIGDLSDIEKKPHPETGKPDDVW